MGTPTIYHPTVPSLCLALLLAACGGGDDAAAPVGDPRQKVADGVEQAVDEAAAKAGAGKFFDPEDKAFRKRSCEFLSPEMVGQTFGVPADALKQMKMMGCIYNWKDDSQVLNAQLMMLRVHKTEEGAKTWFGNATASRTKAELDGQMDQVKGKVVEHEKLDTAVKKNTAGSLTELAKLGTPDEGVAYEDVPGIADQARVSSADGGLWVRLGNMTFQLSAYKGAPQPKMKFDPKNLKGMAKAAMKAQKEWLKETHAERKKAALALAPAVVKAIEAAKP